MGHVLVWVVVGFWVLVWSGLCWLLHQAMLGAAHPGGVVQMGIDWLERWQIPLWLADWLPMPAITWAKTWLVDLMAWAEGLMDWVPALGGWVTALLWLVWGSGTAMLLMLGLVGSVAVAAIRRSRRPSVSVSAGPGSRVD